MSEGDLLTNCDKLIVIIIQFLHIAPAAPIDFKHRRSKCSCRLYTYFRFKATVALGQDPQSHSAENAYYVLLGCRPFASSRTNEIDGKGNFMVCGSLLLLDLLSRA